METANPADWYDALMGRLKDRLYGLLRRSERYTGVDMVYLAQGSFFLNGADMLLAFVSLGLSILIAHYVPKDVYGIYRYVLSIASIAAAFSLTGMNSAVTRAVALGREGALSRSIPVQFRYAVFQFLVAGGVALYYFLRGNDIYALAFAVVAIVAPLSGVANTYAAYLNGKKDFGRMALWRIESGVLNAAAMAVVVIGAPTLVFLTLAYYLSNFVANAWFLWRTFRRYRPNSAFEPDDLAYGKHLSVMNALSTFASQLDSVLVYHLLGPVSLAIYSFATLIPDRLRTSIGYLPSLALPRLAGRTNLELRATGLRRTLMMLTVTALAALGYAVIAPFFFSVFFRQYAAAVPYTMVAGLLLMVTAPKYLTTALTAKGLHRPLYQISVWSPIAKIILSLSLIPFFGIWGAIASRFFAGAFSGALSYVFFRREFSKPDPQ